MAKQSRATLTRKGDRGSYQKADIYAVLDASLLCHVGCVVDGEARVLPTAFVRIGDAIYLHGHLKNNLLQALLDGQVCCLTVTCLDGLVLARSGFHHSVNYRSAVVFGKAEQVNTARKLEILNALVDKMLQGRSQQSRQANEQELNATLVVEIPITEASVKTRSGPPVDAEKDYALPYWAGVLELETNVSEVVACEKLQADIDMPSNVRELM